MYTFVDATAEDNDTPLDVAIEFNHTEVVEYLKSLSQSPTGQLKVHQMNLTLAMLLIWRSHIYT